MVLPSGSFEAGSWWPESRLGLQRGKSTKFDLTLFKHHPSTHRNEWYLWAKSRSSFSTFVPGKMILSRLQQGNDTESEKHLCEGMQPFVWHVKELPHLFFLFLHSRSSIGACWTERTLTPLHFFLPVFQYNMDKAIVDSGTTLLRLPVNVFNAVVTAITRSSLVRHCLATDNDETCQSKRDAGEDNTHSLFKDMVAFRERMRSFFDIKICVCVHVCKCFYVFILILFVFFSCFVGAHK